MRKSETILAASAFVFSYFGFSASAVEAADKCDRFEGVVQTEWVDSGRKMLLLQPFAYVDGACTRWDVPKGIKIDGASIPRAFWTVIGGPFEGPYRNASVVHDYYCDSHTRDWRSVHRMFYNGMLAMGTDPIKAKIMYYAVLAGGPRWKTVTVTNHPQRLFPKPGDFEREEIREWSRVVEEDTAKKDIARIAANNLSIAEIEALAERSSAGAEPADVIEVQ